MTVPRKAKAHESVQHMKTAMMHDCKHASNPHMIVHTLAHASDCHKEHLQPCERKTLALAHFRGSAEMHKFCDLSKQAKPARLRRITS